MIFLARFWPHILGGLAIVWLGLIFKGWHDDAQKLPQVEKEYEVYRAQQETAAKVRKEVSGEYQAELSELRAGRKPAPAVRLCPAPAPVPASGTSGGNHGSAAGAGPLPQVPGPDIGHRLYSDADRADELSAQLRACQSFVRKLQE